MRSLERFTCVDCLAVYGMRGPGYRYAYWNLDTVSQSLTWGCGEYFLGSFH